MRRPTDVLANAMRRRGEAQAAPTKGRNGMMPRQAVGGAGFDALSLAGCGSIRQGQTGNLPAGRHAWLHGRKENET
jgi:hypothetical protein